MASTQPLVKKTIYRFKLSDECNEALADFTQKNHFNIGDRKRFKADWEIWCAQNQDIIDDESIRLRNCGYEGDCITKLFTSVRYYHVKNLIKDQEQLPTEQPPPQKKKRTYISYDKAFLEKISNHIMEHINYDNFKPAVGYDLFINTFTDDIVLERDRLRSDDFSDDDFSFKLKKTYKNRYFNIVK